MSTPVTELSLQQEFGLFPADAQYAKGLRDQYDNPARKNHTIGVDFIPSSLMTDQERSEVLGVVQYADIKGNELYLEQAKQTHLVVHPMDAGLGSSVKRDTYLESLGSNVDRGSLIGIGSKSTDLYFTVPQPDGSFLYMSIAAIKLERIAKEAHMYGGVSISPIVNSDSYTAMASIYLQQTAESLVTGSKQTYTDYLAEKNTVLNAWHMQGDLPTLDVQTKQFTNEHTAPGGHGQAGVMILHDIMNAPDEGTTKVHAIFNGDGPNNFVTPEMVSYTAENAGIVMLNTTRTPVDVKGGIIGGEVHPDGTLTPQILEIAQAKAAGQQTTFMDLGLKTENLPEEMQQQHQTGEQYFNTNIALMNESVLRPFLQQLKKEVGEDLFAQLLTPELILNRKEKNGKQFDQLEGALGSLILRLNALVQTNEHVSRIWNEVSGGKTFLKIVNTQPEDRDETFLPNKFPIDFVMQASSDHFALDTSSWIVKNAKPGHLPRFEGDLVKNGTYYSDVQNILRSFGYTRIQDLDELHIEGPVSFANAQLAGKVHIVNESGKLIDFNDSSIKTFLGDQEEFLTLRNVRIHIAKDESISVEWHS